MLIAQNERRVDCFSRTDDGWLLRVTRPPVDVVTLSALGVDLPLEAVYRNTGV